MTVKEYLQKQLSYNKEKRNILDSRINELQELIREMEVRPCSGGLACNGNIYDCTLDLFQSTEG